MPNKQRKCSKCGHTYSQNDFPIMVKLKTSTVYRSHCKQCDRKLNKERQKLKKIHGAAPPDHTCPICLRNERDLKEQTKLKSLWVIDHDHHNGEFRGWLCHSCNRGMGMLGDDIQRLERAIKYLMGDSI